jgi:mannosyl-3-phosphoglycerate phosphatase family protein
MDAHPGAVPTVEPLPARGLSCPSSLVVVTDVDGVLRDADTGSWAEARAALQLLASHDIPLVLASGHCAAEMIRLQRTIGVRQPFIAEHGAALFIPEGYFADLPGLGTSAGSWEVIDFGERRPIVCDALCQVAERLGLEVIGLSRLSAEQLASREGLPSRDAHVALQREYDEPFLLPRATGAGRTQLFNAMRHAGFRCFSGPRFHHATGVQDPAHAIRLLISLYRLAGDGVVVVGLGDDWADRVLLQEVDVPVVVRNPAVDQRRLLRKVPAAYLTTARGPAGWSEAIVGSFVA